MSYKIVKGTAQYEGWYDQGDVVEIELYLEDYNLVDESFSTLDDWEPEDIIEYVRDLGYSVTNEKHNLRTSMVMEKFMANLDRIPLDELEALIDKHSV